MLQDSTTTALALDELDHRWEEHSYIFEAMLRILSEQRRVVRPLPPPVVSTGTITTDEIIADLRYGKW